MSFANRSRLFIALVIIPLVLSVSAQDEDLLLPAVGDVPLANKIQVTVDQEDETQAVIQGEAGAVFPNAFVAVQNLYTGDREIVSSTSNGEFTTSLYGRDQTPYWIAAFQRFPSDEMINNAMGTTVYGEGEENTFYVEANLGGNVPRYRIWGEVNTTELTDNEPLTVSLDVELDVTDDFPRLDNLEVRLDVEMIEFDPTTLTLPDVQTSSKPIDVVDNKIVFSVEFTFDTTFLFQAAPHFIGYIRAGEGDWERWEISGLFNLLDSALEDDFTSSLPIIIEKLITNRENTLEWGMLMDIYHHGIRGLFPSVPPPTAYPIKWHGTLNVISPDSYALDLSLLNQAFYDVSRDIWDGGLYIEIERPSGQVDKLEAGILQSQTYLDNRQITLVADDPALREYPFDEYGDYEITATISIMVDDREYTSKHGYDVRIAEPLQLTPTTLLGTPFENGDVIALSGHISPQVPATVEIGFVAQAIPSMESIMSGNDMELPAQSVDVSVQSNTYGYFVTEPFYIDESNFYLVRYTATYEDSSGRLWSSDQIVSNSFIANSESNLMAHGQRGLVDYDGNQYAWFDTTVYPNDDRNAGRQPYFPYYAGDVAYVPDAPDGGIAPKMTPSYSTDDAMSYSLSVVSPNGNMRYIADVSTGFDIRFDGEDTFNQQIGMGIDGIRAGDYAFLFGGVSVGDESAIYGSLMVVEDEDAPARVLSPFMDKLKVFGQEVDMFFVPTGVRPAQVLMKGDMLSIVGQVAPTLSAEVEVTVTSPSGQITQFEDVANAVGYFYSAENDVPLDEIGIWHIDIVMSYRGETSAGQLERPYPEGSLSYDVYVVPPENPSLGEADFITETTKTNTIYSLSIPDGWTDVRAFATVTTPSWILAQEELTVFPSGTSYTFNPTQLAREYPNVELLETAEGNHVADVVTLTLVMTGLDADGNPAIRTRTYTILHDVTYSTDGGQIVE